MKNYQKLALFVLLLIISCPCKEALAQKSPVSESTARTAAGELPMSDMIRDLLSGDFALYPPPEELGDTPLEAMNTMVYFILVYGMGDRTASVSRHQLRQQYLNRGEKTAENLNPKDLMPDSYLQMHRSNDRFKGKEGAVKLPAGSGSGTSLLGKKIERK